MHNNNTHRYVVPPARPCSSLPLRRPASAAPGAGHAQCQNSGCEYCELTTPIIRASQRLLRTAQPKSQDMRHASTRSPTQPRWPAGFHRRTQVQDDVAIHQVVRSGLTGQPLVAKSAQAPTAAPSRDGEGRRRRNARKAPLEGPSSSAATLAHCNCPASQMLVRVLTTVKRMLIKQGVVLTGHVLCMTHANCRHL